MKKIAKLTAVVVAVMMVAGMLPVMSVSAALSNYSNQLVLNNFNGFVKNTPTLSSLADNSVKKVGYSLTNAGVAADYEPVTGVFGKSADDTSVKITRITSSSANASIGLPGKQVDGGNIAEGEYMTMNWNWAFGDFDVERSLEAEFYYKDQSWNNRTKFSYGSDDKALSDILTIFPDGRIRLFGKVLPNRYYFNTNEWYEFEVRILGGRTTDEATEDAPAVKSVAYLYIDGALVGQKEINNAKDSATTITRPGSIATAQFLSKGVKYAGSARANKETTYIDDLNFGKFKPTSTYYTFKSYGDLSVNSEKVYTDGIHLALKDAVTAQEFIDSLVLGADVKAVKLLDENGVQVTDMSLEVQPGWFLNVSSNIWKPIAKDENNNDIKGYHSYNRKITDSLTFAKNNYEGSSNILTESITRTVGYYNSNTNYAYNYSLANFSKNDSYFVGKEANAYYVADKYNTTSQGPGEMKLYFDASSISADKYVLEFAAVRKEVEGNFAQASLIAGGGLQTVLAISDSGVAVKTDEGDWLFNNISNKKDKTQERWYKLALEVDAVAKTAKVYVNGEYTGVTRKCNDVSVLKTFGILCDNRTNYATVKGIVGIDDINIYSGSYKSEAVAVESSNKNIVKISQDRLRVTGDVSVEEFKAATGAKAIYKYVGGTFGAEVTEGNVSDGDVAVFYGDSTVVKYCDIEFTTEIGDVIFNTDVEGKITASMNIETRSATNYIGDDITIFIAKKDGNKLTAVDSFTVSDFSEIKTYELSATIDYIPGDKVIAYVWKNGVTPYILPVVYQAD